jgi:hypothetical protein
LQPQRTPIWWLVLHRNSKTLLHCRRQLLARQRLLGKLPTSLSATQDLDVDGARYALSPGMQVSSEIHLGTRSIPEYVLSPVHKAWHEVGRER